jgi:tetratricopeptide (TPR) repeat protein
VTGYTARDVAKLLGLTVGQVRAWARAGLLAPERGERGEYRFTFQDLVLLQAAKELLAARIPARKVRRALARLRDQLPTGRPLSAVRIVADGKRILVRDGMALWNPESGQELFDFEVAELARKVAPLARQAAPEARSMEGELGAEDWYELGCEIEPTLPEQARDAYRRAIELDPHHVDAHVNLGRLLHEAGELAAAEAHYRLALAARPDDATASYNLGVVLEDRGQPRDAVAAYERALSLDPSCADAHYNLARLYERLGQRRSALRHLDAYRKLSEE